MNLLKNDDVDIYKLFSRKQRRRSHPISAKCCEYHFWLDSWCLWLSPLTVFWQFAQKSITISKFANPFQIISTTRKWNSRTSFTGRPKGGQTQGTLVKGTMGLWPCRKMQLKWKCWKGYSTDIRLRYLTVLRIQIIFCWDFMICSKKENI